MRPVNRLLHQPRQEITTVQIMVVMVKAERNGLDFYYILNVNKTGLIL